MHAWFSRSRDLINRSKLKRRNLHLSNLELGETSGAVSFAIHHILQLRNVSRGQCVHNGPELTIQSDGCGCCGAKEAHPHRHGQGATWPRASAAMTTSIVSTAAPRHSSFPHSKQLLCCLRYPPPFCRVWFTSTASYHKFKSSSLHNLYHSPHHIYPSLTDFQITLPTPFQKFRDFSFLWINLKQHQPPSHAHPSSLSGTRNFNIISVSTPYLSVPHRSLQLRFRLWSKSSEVSLSLWETLNKFNLSYTRILPQSLPLWHQRSIKHSILLLPDIARKISAQTHSSGQI